MRGNFRPRPLGIDAVNASIDHMLVNTVLNKGASVRLPKEAEGICLIIGKEKRNLPITVKLKVSEFWMFNRDFRDCLIGARRGDHTFVSAWTPRPSIAEP